MFQIDLRVKEIWYIVGGVLLGEDGIRVPKDTTISSSTVPLLLCYVYQLHLFFALF